MTSLRCWKKQLSGVKKRMNEDELKTILDSLQTAVIELSKEVRELDKKITGNWPSEEDTDVEDTHDWIPANQMTTGSLMKCSKCGKTKLEVYMNSDFKCSGENDGNKYENRKI